MQTKKCIYGKTPGLLLVFSQETGADFGWPLLKYQDLSSHFLTLCRSDSSCCTRCSCESVEVMIRYCHNTLPTITALSSYTHVCNTQWITHQSPVMYHIYICDGRRKKSAWNGKTFCKRWDGLKIHDRKTVDDLMSRVLQTCPFFSSGLRMIKTWFQSLWHLMVWHVSSKLERRPTITTRTTSWEVRLHPAGQTLHSWHTARIKGILHPKSFPIQHWPPVGLTRSCERFMVLPPDRIWGPVFATQTGIPPTT